MLNSDYTEPNIKSKGALLPRKAVLPIPVVTPAATNKIQLVEEEDRSQRGSVTQSTSTPVSASIQPGQSKALVKPKTEFEIVDEGAAFVFTIMLPEEVGPAGGSCSTEKKNSYLLLEACIPFGSKICIFHPHEVACSVCFSSIQAGHRFACQCGRTRCVNARSGVEREG